MPVLLHFNQKKALPSLVAGETLFVSMYKAVTRVRMETAAFMKLNFVLKYCVGSESTLEKQNIFSPENG